MIYAICNQKGGVGKTTTTFHLSRAAVLRGRRVLLVDADPQGNLTSVTAAEQVAKDQPGLADALSSRTGDTFTDVIVPGIWPGLLLVPTTGQTLGAVRDELIIAGPGRERRLRDALAELGNDYDDVFIDCAPSLDQLTINALTAATDVVIVSHAKLWSANGLGQLLDTIGSVRTYYNPELRIGGLIINQFEEKTVSARAWHGELGAAAADHGIAILGPPVPKRVVIADAAEAARGLDEWGSADATLMGTLYGHQLDLLEAQARARATLENDEAADVRTIVSRSGR